MEGADDVIKMISKVGSFVDAVVAPVFGALDGLDGDHLFRSLLSSETESLELQDVSITLLGSEVGKSDFVLQLVELQKVREELNMLLDPYRYWQELSYV